MGMIQTERVLLRPFRSDDLAEIHAIYAEEWPYFRGPLSASIDETREIVERHMAIQAEHGFSLWVAREKATGEVVGDCGLQPLELRGLDVELGYRLGRRHWGRGLATEAATACLRAAFEELGLDRIVAVAHPDNAASRRVLEKIGFVYEGLGPHYGGAAVYSCSSGRWK